MRDRRAGPSPSQRTSATRVDEPREHARQAGIVERPRRERPEPHVQPVARRPSASSVTVSPATPCMSRLSTASSRSSTRSTGSSNRAAIPPSTSLPTLAVALAGGELEERAAPVGRTATAAQRSPVSSRRGRPRAAPSRRVVHREHAVEQGDLEDPADVGIGQTTQTVRPRAQPLERAEEHAERHRVDERRLAKIDHERRRRRRRSPPRAPHAAPAQCAGRPARARRSGPTDASSETRSTPKSSPSTSAQGSLLVAHHCTNALPAITGAQTWCDSGRFADEKETHDLARRVAVVVLVVVGGWAVSKLLLVPLVAALFGAFGRRPPDARPPRGRRSLPAAEDDPRRGGPASALETEHELALATVARRRGASRRRGAGARRWPGCRRTPSRPAR